MHLHAVLQINAVAAGQKKNKTKKKALFKRLFLKQTQELEFKTTKPNLQTCNFHTVGKSHHSVREECEGFSGSCLE